MTLFRKAFGLWAALTVIFLATGADAALQMREDGLQYTDGGIIVSITALRDDVLRVRIGRDGIFPADESWAVLPEARSAHVKVVAEGGDVIRTGAVRARIDPSGAVTIMDLQGHSLFANSGLAAFRATAPQGFALEFTMGKDAHFFGLGDKMGPLDRRGRLFSLWNTDAYRFQESTDPLYKAIPFFLSVERGRVAGLFLDNSFRTTFDFGASAPDLLSIGAQDGPIDYYVFAGPDPKSVLSAYGWLTGTPPLPPLWAFGFQQSRHGCGQEAQIRGVAERLRADRIPADVIWLDIDVLKNYRAFDVGHDNIPDFPKMVGDFAAQGLQTVLITDLHLEKKPGYAPYESGVAGDHFLKMADGSLYVGAVWPGPSVFPDFTRKVTRDWWGGLFAPLLGDGVAGIWNDMNEPAVFRSPGKTMPPDVRHRIEEEGFAPRVATHAEIHNVYGMLNSKATYEGLLALRPNQRPFVMTRASFAGGQRYAVTWTGDNSATWNHLRLSTPQLESLGLGGFAFAGVDIGGYAGTPSADLLTQWIALGMFNPIARDHSSKASAPQEVWVHGPGPEASRRKSIEGRYRLMPYIYTLAEEASRTGIPMMRPLFLEFPHVAGGRPLDLEASGEFMWGRALLIAPSPWPESPADYDVLLPPGDWYDQRTGRKVMGAKPAHWTDASGTEDAMAGSDQEQTHLLTVHPDGENLPVFVRAGAILPSQPLVQSTQETPSGPLRLDVYPGPDCQGEVYWDDGRSFDFRRGVMFRQSFRCAIAPDGTVEVGLGEPKGSFKPWWDRVAIVVHRACGDGTVTLDAPFHAQIVPVETCH